MGDYKKLAAVAVIFDVTLTLSIFGISIIAFIALCCPRTCLRPNDINEVPQMVMATSNYSAGPRFMPVSQMSVEQSSEYNDSMQKGANSSL